MILLSIERIINLKDTLKSITYCQDVYKVLIKKDNIVRLTAREHFICHLLLTKMYKEGSVEWIKMTKAFMNMYRQSKENQQRYCPSKWYEYCRIKLCSANSLNQIGENNSCYGTCWIINLQTRDIKRIKKEEFHDYEKQGYIKGRSFDERYRLCNGRYKKLTVEQKERNTKIRVQKYRQTIKQRGPLSCYVNKQNGQRKYFSNKQVVDLSLWEPTWSKFKVQEIDRLLKEGKTWEQIADYYNTSYWSIYTWYKPFRKQKLKEFK